MIDPLICPSCGSANLATATNCAKCRINLAWAIANSQPHSDEEQQGIDDVLSQLFDIPITTTPTIEGRPITRYLGIIGAEVAFGVVGNFRITTALSDLFNIRETATQNKLRQARILALQELAAEAAKLKADAIVGVSLRLATLVENAVLMTASGTAVSLADGQRG
jgi:uncharacterized protein YbjQ (UPF0145 family)